MKAGSKLRLILIGLFLSGAVGSGLIFLLSPITHENISPAGSRDAIFGWKFPVAKFPSTGLEIDHLAYSDIRDPGGVPRGLPVRLEIPAIGVNSAIEDALITPDGRMDVPAGSVNVAWFAFGPKPGQIGSAVIGGHYGIQDGVPFVFFSLNQLKIGDKIYVIDDGGNTLAFMVRSIASFDRNADATTVFTSSDGLAHLNLITCEGIWNQVNGTYPLRLVIFTDKISTKEVSSAAIVAIRRTLRKGTSGADVAALQVVLKQRGFLMIPPGVPEGFFGTLTRTAVAKYQTSVGLPSVGIFGPLTRARLISDMDKAPTLPNTGVVNPSTSLSFLKNLYATPIDGLVTSILIIMITIMAFKVIVLLL